MGKRKKQVWQAGDIFSMPLGDSRFGLGQVISPEKKCMDSVLCAFFSTIVSDPEAAKNWQPHLNELISVQIITRAALDKHFWKIIHSAIPLNVSDIFPICSLREAYYVGASIKDSSIMEELLTAYHGLTPWDDAYDPEYFDKLLAPGVKRPPNVIFKKDIKN